MYLALAVSKTHKWAKWLHHPCQLGGPLHSARDKLSNGDVAHAVAGAHIWAKWFHHPYHPGVPNARCSERVRNGGLTQSGTVSGLNDIAAWLSHVNSPFQSYMLCSFAQCACCLVNNTSHHGNPI